MKCFCFSIPAADHWYDGGGVHVDQTILYLCEDTGSSLSGGDSVVARLTSLSLTAISGNANISQIGALFQVDRSKFCG